MDHKYSAGLENVRLRPLRKEDIEKLRIWRNDPDISRFLSPIPYITENMQEKWFEKYLLDPDELIFAIEETDCLNRMVGSLSLYNFKDNEESFMKFVGIIIFINFVFLTFGVLTNSMLLSDRLKSMLYVFELFIIPYIYKNLRSRNQQILYISSIGVIMIIITICSLSPSLAYPYRSIFFKGHYIY